MIKRTAAALAMAFTVACASTPMTSSSETAGTAGNAVITTSVRNAPDYVLLSAPNQVRSYDFANAVGVRALHVRGTMTNRGFIPAGDIQGAGKFCADGTDMLSLSDLTIYKAGEGKTPTGSYILGCAIGTSFQPASRSIVTQ